MMLLFFILIVLASVVISFFILIQNPKGGGLSGSIAGFNSQFMGVKQTTDVLEKGTWLLAVVIGLMSIFSVVFMRGTSSNEPNIRPNTQQSAPVTTPPAGALPQPPAPQN